MLPLCGMQLLACVHQLESHYRGCCWRVIGRHAVCQQGVVLLSAVTAGAIVVWHPHCCMCHWHKRRIGQDCGEADEGLLTAAFLSALPSLRLLREYSVVIDYDFLNDELPGDHHLLHPSILQQLPPLDNLVACYLDVQPDQQLQLTQIKQLELDYISTRALENLILDEQSEVISMHEYISVLISSSDYAVEAQRLASAAAKHKLSDQACIRLQQDRGLAAAQACISAAGAKLLLTALACAYPKLTYIELDDMEVNASVLSALPLCTKHLTIDR